MNQSLPKSLSLWCPFYLRKPKTCICLLYHFSTHEWRRFLIPFLEGKQGHTCHIQPTPSRLASWRRKESLHQQPFIGQVCPEYSGFGTRMVKVTDACAICFVQRMYWGHMISGFLLHFHFVDEYKRAWVTTYADHGKGLLSSGVTFKVTTNRLEFDYILSRSFSWRSLM